MRSTLTPAVTQIALAVLALCSLSAGPLLGEEKTRTIQLNYAGDIVDLAPGALVRVWVPRPVTSRAQTVELLGTSFPAAHRTTVGSLHDNQFFYWEKRAPENGKLSLSVSYKITRFELTPSRRESIRPEQAKTYLLGSRLVPSVGLTDRLFDRAPDGSPSQIGQATYTRVLDHMNYSKPAGKPWGRGDANWACDSRYGNCTDFHSVFMSLMREAKIPSYFEIGFSLPQEPSGTISGYHCWAFFAEKRQWSPVDISEADKHPELRDYYFGKLTQDRVALTKGRDLILEPEQDGPPVNFMVLPYVEVDKKPHKPFQNRISYHAAQPKAQ